MSNGLTEVTERLGDGEFERRAQNVGYTDFRLLGEEEIC
jgi:hypothetical protein